MPVTPLPDTGHGASVTFGTSSWAGKILGIPTNLAIRREPVNKSNLGTSGQEEFIAGDLESLGEITLDVLFEAGRGLPATTTTAETVTITWPLNPSDGSATAANLAGTALITGTNYPALQTGQIQTGQITIKFDGGTGPTWTNAA